MVPQVPGHLKTHIIINHDHHVKEITRCFWYSYKSMVQKLHQSMHIWAASWQNQQSDYAPSEDSDQPGHPPSLIRVFAVRMKKAWVFNYPLRAQRRLIRLGGCPGWCAGLMWVFAGHTVTLLVLSCRCSYPGDPYIDLKLFPPDIVTIWSWG